jgi:hypothetical protein
VLLAFLHLLPTSQARAEILQRRLAFLEDPQRGFFHEGQRVLRQGELTSPFRAGLQRIARITSSAEREWLTETLIGMESGPTS